MRSAYRIVNLYPRPSLGDLPNTTYGAPIGPGTTGVSPWDLATMTNRLEPSTTSEETSDDIWAMKNENKPPKPPPAPPEIYVSDVLENPENAEKPYPRFITEDEASAKRNLTGLAVAGGTFVALVAAGLIAFR